MPPVTDYEAVLLDIEGTTTPVHFVYEVLFPYAQRELKNYLERHWNDPGVQQDIEDLVEHIAQTPRDQHGRMSVDLEDQSNVEAFRSAVIEHITWQMENDKKVTPLKSLQGRVWQSGYKDGELEAPIFDDVPKVLQRWQDREIPVYIYSSGSVDAQKLLFEHTDAGDLREYLQGYFDTKTGSKKEAQSYRAIAEQIEVEPQQIVFATDSLEEARAAREAGVQAVIAHRPGNADLPAHDFPVIDTLDALLDK